MNPLAPLKAGLIRGALVLVRMVLGRPRLKRLARAVLTASPRLHARVHGLMFRAALAHAAGPRAGSAAQLSQRAHVMYLQLKRAKAARTP